MNRHYIVCRLADKYLAQMSHDDILAECPADYGSVITDDHRLLVWNLLYDDYDRLGDLELYEDYTKYVVHNRPFPKNVKDILMNTDEFTSKTMHFMIRR